MSGSSADAGEPWQIAGVLATRFAEIHHRPPDGVWRAPGRVNLIGEHVDYNGGRSLPIAIPHATYAAIGLRTDGRVTAMSDQYPDVFRGRIGELEPELITGWHAYAVGVVWALREAGVAASGVDIVVASTVPVGAGLSSSAALESAVSIGLAELSGLTIDDAVRHRLVEAGIRAEREVAGAPTGGMDQTVSLFASEGHALLIDFSDGATEHVGWSPDAAGVELIVVDSRVSHALTDGGYASRRSQCDAAAVMLGVSSLRDVDRDRIGDLDDDVLRSRVRHVVTELARVDEALDAISRRDWNALGGVFDASHASLRDDFAVSCDELDLVCEASVAAGGHGARMTGGGFGGSVIVLAPTARTDEICVAILAAFRSRGWNSPQFLRVQASAGASRVV